MLTPGMRRAIKAACETLANRLAEVEAERDDALRRITELEREAAQRAEAIATVTAQNEAIRASRRSAEIALGIAQSAIDAIVTTAVDEAGVVECRGCDGVGGYNRPCPDCKGTGFADG